jgi:hypothetical protein
MTLDLTLAPASFDRDTLASLPFTLFHECVSHILQGPWAAERPRPDRGSQFAEGWMDRAAWEVFTTALSQIVPCRAVKLLPYPCRDGFYRDGGWRMCEARHDTRRTNGSSHEMWVEAHRRNEGWSAADLVLQALQELDVAEPVPTFLRFSFELNASTESPTQRDKLARWLADGLRPLIVPLESRRAEMLNGLQTYADGGDLPRLLAAIQSAASPTS